MARTQTQTQGAQIWTEVQAQAQAVADAYGVGMDSKEYTNALQGALDSLSEEEYEALEAYWESEEEVVEEPQTAEEMAEEEQTEVYAEVAQAQAHIDRAIAEYRWSEEASRIVAQEWLYYMEEEATAIDIAEVLAIYEECEERGIEAPSIIEAVWCVADAR